MTRLAIIVRIEVTTGSRDQLLRFLKAHRARCLRDARGLTLQLEVLAAYDDAPRALTYEVYRDDAAFEMHRNGRSLAQFREDTAGMILKAEVTKCALLAG